MIRTFLTIVFVCIGVLTAFPKFAGSTDIDPLATLDNKGEYLVWIKIQSKHYGISAERLKKVIKCESGYNSYAIGDGGKAYGLLQFHEPTFNSFKKKSGLAVEYKNPKDQITLAAWSWTNGYQSHWTCYKKTA